MCGCGCNKDSEGTQCSSIIKEKSFEAIKKGFAKIGIIIEDESHLVLLEKLAESGKDEAGYMIDENGNPIYFDYYKVVADSIINYLK